MSKSAAAGWSACEPLEQRALLSASLLDPTFGGGDGIVTTAVGSGISGAAAVAVQADGKILAAGTATGPTTGTDFALVRYNADGSIDKSFGGGDGITTLSLGAGDDTAAAVSILAGGKILVAGSATTGTGTGQSLDFAVARFNADGSLDKTFGGGDGIVTAGFGAGTRDTGRAMVVRTDGTILVAGGTAATASASPTLFAIARFTSNGVLDKAFGGGDGLVTTDFSDSDLEVATALAAGPGGSFYVAGLAGSFAGKMVLAKYSSGGVLDTQFADKGKVAVGEFAFGAAAMAVLPAGKIIISAPDNSGSWNQRAGGRVSPKPSSPPYSTTFAQFNPDGTPDISFATTGTVRYEWPDYGYDGAGGLIALPAGQILLAGGNGFAAVRLNADGTLDPTYDGEDGYFLPDLSGSAPAAAATADGKAVMAGMIDDKFAVVRLKNVRLPAPGDADDQISETFTSPNALIPVGGSKSGSISTTTDVDMYKFTVKAGQRLAFDLDRAAGSGLDSILRIFDGNGTQLASNDDAPAPGESASTFESYLSHYFSDPGTFYVGVSGSSNGSYSPTYGWGDVAGSTGAYVLRLSNVPAPADTDDQIVEAPTVGVGGAARTGSVANDTDVDMVKFTVSAGERIGIDADIPSGSQLRPYLRLFAADGTELSHDSGNSAPGETWGDEAYVAYRFDRSGTYYIGLSGLGPPFDNDLYDPITGTGDKPGGTGAYSINLTLIPNDPDDQISEAVALTPGVTRTGSIDAVADVDMFKFTAPAGKLIRLDVDRPTGSGLNSKLRLFDASGSPLADSDDDAAPGEPLSTESYIEYGVSETTTLYVAVAGQNYPNYDPVTGDGDYLYGTKGAYKLTLSVVPVPNDPDDQLKEAVLITPGKPFSGSIGMLDVDMVKFNALAGDLITVGGSGNVGYRLFDSSGQQVNEYYGLDVLRSGTYYMGISSYGNTNYDPVTGSGDQAAGGSDYTLTVSRTRDPDDQISEAVAVNQAAAGALDVAHDVDMYKFVVPTSGYEAHVDVTTDSGWAALRLFDVHGSELPGTSPDSGSVQMLRLAAGTYYAGVSVRENVGYDAVTGAGDAHGYGYTGSYELHVTLLPPDSNDQIAEVSGTLLTLGQAKSGTLDTPYDADLYAFRATAGTAISVDLDRGASGVADAVLRVFDSAGNPIARSDDNYRAAPGEGPNREAYLDFMPATTGVYYVGVSGSGNDGYHATTGMGDRSTGKTGSYQVTLTTIPNDPNDQIGEALPLLTIGSSTTGTIAVPGDVNLYKLNLSAGDRVAFDIDRPAGSGIDPVLRLFDSTGYAVASNDDAAAPGESPTNESYLQIRVSQAGVYYVGVSAHENDAYDPLTGLADRGGTTSGSYVLRIIRTV